MAVYVCQIPECDNELKPGSRLDTCSLCRASINRWAKRRPAEVIERRRKLHMYDHRMSEVVDDEPTLKPKPKKARGGAR
jgi:hypothetical protein